MKNRLAIIGGVIIFLFITGAIFAPLISLFDPMSMNLAEALKGASLKHFLGQDGFGRDIFSRVIYGAKISLTVGILATLFSLLIGLILGSISGYYGGLFDDIFMRIVDIMYAFPGILLLIALAAVLGPSLKNVVIALSITGWASYARVVRGQFLATKENEYVLAARSIGLKDWRIIWRHIWPNIFAPVIVQATFGMAGCIIAESSLSFLGLGVPTGTPSWGAMLDHGVEVLIEAPWVATWPGIAIMLVVLGFNFLGDGLRDRLDPKEKASFN